MAYKRLSFIKLVGAIQKKIEEKTGLKCYDYVDRNAPSPFYFAEVVKSTPANTKTMFRDNFTVWIHCIAEPSNSSLGLYNLIESLQEAMTEDVELPEPFKLIMQTDNGIQTIKTDETNEKHGIVAFEFMICYGFKCKI